MLRIKSLFAVVMMIAVIILTYKIFFTRTLLTLPTYFQKKQLRPRSRLISLAPQPSLSPQPPPPPTYRLLHTPQPPPPPPITHFYASIFQQLCAWQFEGQIETGEQRCCNFDTAQRTKLVRAIAPFVALKPAAPLLVVSPPFAANDRLNCKTDRWSGSSLFTGQQRDYSPLVVDIFIAAAEMELIEARLWELLESVDYVIIGMSSKNHRGDPQPNWFQHARDKQSRFTSEMLERILLVDVSNCYAHTQAKREAKNINHDAEWSHQLTQRDCLWEHGVLALKKELLDGRGLKTGIPDDTVFIFTDVDELPDRELVHHIKHCSLQHNALPAYLRMRIAGHNFRMPCSDGVSKFTGASEIAEWKTIREDGGIIYRFRVPEGAQVRPRNKHAIDDAGIHLTWYGSMALVDYKGFTHAEGGYMAPMWSADGKSAGSYCDANNADDNRILSKRQQMANSQPLKFVRFWEHHDSISLPNVLQAARENKKSIAADLYRCHMPWVAVENPERFVWFWGAGTASMIDELADPSILSSIDV
jgi:hypothetical protein